MSERDKVLTTFQAAEYCRVSPFTIRNWIESGALPAYKTPGGHRRILKQDLEEFMKKHGMPPPEGKESSPRVLVVDDDKRVAELLVRVVAEVDPEAKVKVAHDGFEAGALVTSFKPTLVILDLRMPGLDGFQVCERITGDPALRETTVLGITGYFSPEHESRFKECGGWRLLQKPVEVETLKECLRSVLARSAEEARRP